MGLQFAPTSNRGRDAWREPKVSPPAKSSARSPSSECGFSSRLAIGTAIDSRPSNRSCPTRSMRSPPAEPSAKRLVVRLRFAPAVRVAVNGPAGRLAIRSEEPTSELQSLMTHSYAVFCLKKKKKLTNTQNKENANELKRQIKRENK